MAIYQNSESNSDTHTTIRYRAIDQDTAEVIYNGRKFHVSVGGWYEADDIDGGEPSDIDEGFLGMDIDIDGISTPSGRRIESADVRREVGEAVAAYFRDAGINAKID